MTPTYLGHLLADARRDGWERTRRRMQGGWAVHEWFHPGKGVAVEIVEQAHGTVRLQVGVTTAALPNEPSGGMTATLPVALDVLTALGHLPKERP